MRNGWPARVAAVQPDVIVFQEYTAESAARLAATLGTLYPYRFEHPRDDAFGQAVYSKLAFTAPPRAFPAAGAHEAWGDPQVRASVQFGARAVGVMDVHLVPPSTAVWFNQLRRDTLKLAALAAKEPGAFIMAGDFNATPRSRNLAALRRAGLRDAYAEAGRGRGTSWPRTMPLMLAPGVRIDHILYSSDLECVEAGVCGDIGSDHRPTWARFVAR
jgi:endonuclease/exonuclease/phosphatase (EEP) superfamily protein YafD